MGHRGSRGKANAVNYPIGYFSLELSQEQMFMSNILKLNCWVLGDDPHHIFPVKVASSKMVIYLKKAIKDEKKHVFNDLDADSLDL